MSEPYEGKHSTQLVNERSYDVWPLIWPDGRKSWEVRDVETDTLLTMDESLDQEPLSDELIGLWQIRNDAVVELAREAWQKEGSVEIDDGAEISDGNENGAYVQAWVWVDFAGTKYDKGDDDEDEPSKTLAQVRAGDLHLHEDHLHELLHRERGEQ